ncbi:hypothetical protein BC943DRAFT_327393, partial [Umbelopsis sp. AD052]
LFTGCSASGYLANNATTISHSERLRLSIVWAAIWKVHWHCLSEQLPWSLPMCLQTIRSTDFLSCNSTD